jgi:tellurite methyltransferase
VRETARAHGISLGVSRGTADALPFADGSFDFVLSWSVIHHGSLGDVGRRLAEIWRVLKPKALYQGTMLPTRNVNYGKGRSVAPDTFVRDRAEEPRASRSDPLSAVMAPKLKAPGRACPTGPDRRHP